MSTTIGAIADTLGGDAKSLLEYRCKGIPKERLHLPGPDVVDRVWAASDRTTPVLRSIQAMIGHGRLAGTGYLSILPVDQGIEHSAGASFARNPAYFDPESIVKLALEGGCNAVASTLGVLGAVARKYAHKIPFLVKFNHNEFLTYPNKFDQIFFARVKQARDMGAVAVGATVYFGSDQSARQIIEVSQAFEAAHEMGLATVLWCYLRNPAFKMDKDYHLSADLTGQANHLGVTIEADIIKQKLPENNGGYNARGPGRAHLLRGGLGGERLRGGGEDRGREQAGGRDGAHLGTQGLPAADGRGDQAAQPHPGRLPLQGGDGGVGGLHLGRSVNVATVSAPAGSRDMVPASAWPSQRPL